MKKSQLIDILKLYDKKMPIKIWIFDPELLWHETDSFSIDADSRYIFEDDSYEDILVLDQAVYTNKQNVESLIKTLSKETKNLDICLLRYDDVTDNEGHHFDLISNFSITVSNDYLLIK